MSNLPAAPRIPPPSTEPIRSMLVPINIHGAIKLLVRTALVSTTTLEAAAKMLGITRHALKRWIVKYRIDWPMDARRLSEAAAALQRDPSVVQVLELQRGVDDVDERLLRARESLEAIGARLDADREALESMAERARALREDPAVSVRLPAVVHGPLPPGAAIGPSLAPATDTEAA